MEKGFFDLEDVPWAAVRPELTSGVLGRTLFADRQLRLVWVRVEPGGEFRGHRDPYPHLFVFLQGEGEFRLGEERHAIRPGRVVQVPAGTAHGYRNTGTEDLLLLSGNLP